MMREAGEGKRSGESMGKAAVSGSVISGKGRTGLFGGPWMHSALQGGLAHCMRRRSSVNYRSAENQNGNPISNMDGAILKSEAVVPRRILVGVLVCLAVSLLIALSSYLSAALHYGTSAYLVNGDEHVYLAIARIPYWGGWALRDPFSHATDRVPTLHAWALFVPPAKLTVALRLPVTQIPLVMRVLGATLLPLALFLLFWQLFRQSPKRLQWTVCCTVVCLADADFVGGRSFIANNARWVFVFSTFGEILVLAVLCMLADRVSAQGRVAFVALLACTALVMSGVWIRYIEVTQCAEPRAYTQALLATAPFAPALLEKKTDCTIAGSSLEAKVLLVHTECAQLYSSPQTAGTSLISMAEVDERHSLNGWLEGLSSEEYRRSTPQDGYSTASTFGHPEWKRNAILARRMALFSGLSIRWRATVQKYRPTHLLLPQEKTPNPLLPWREIARANGLVLYALGDAQ